MHLATGKTLPAADVEFIIHFFNGPTADGTFKLTAFVGFVDVNPALSWSMN